MFLILIVGILFSPISTKGAFIVSIGDTFTYKVETSYMSAKYGANSDSVTKYRIFFDPYEVGTTFIVNVTDIVSGIVDEVEFDIITSTDTYSFSNDMVSFQVNFIFTLFKPSMDAMAIASAWPTWDFENGTAISLSFFFDTDSSTLDYFDDWVTTPVLESYSTISGWEDTHIEAHFDDAGTVAVFDWILEGSLVYTTDEQINMDGYYRYTLAFNKATGVLQGYRFESDFKGTIDGVTYERKEEQEVHLTGYSIPGYYFAITGNYGLSFKWYIPILVFSSLVIVLEIKRKRK
jgi:hypothetical protein